MGFDDAFIRKWEYYFAYCHAGFRAEIIDLVQMVLNKPE
jgi:cyclopropane-fatty-acyl-phospholipid synthase